MPGIAAALAGLGEDDEDLNWACKAKQICTRSGNLPLYMNVVLKVSRRLMVDACRCKWQSEAHLCRVDLPGYLHFQQRHGSGLHNLQTKAQNDRRQGDLGRQERCASRPDRRLLPESAAFPMCALPRTAARMPCHQPSIADTFTEQIYRKIMSYCDSPRSRRRCERE